MDIVQGFAVFATGAAGCLSMAKLMQTLERRRNAKHGVSDQPAKDLFPNGEKAAIIKAIHDLQDDGEASRRCQRKIMDHLGILP